MAGPQDRSVYPGDRVVSVNGTTSPSLMLQAGILRRKKTSGILREKLRETFSRCLRPPADVFGWTPKSLGNVYGSFDSQGWLWGCVDEKTQTCVKKSDETDRCPAQVVEYFGKSTWFWGEIRKVINWKLYYQNMTQVSFTPRCLSIPTLLRSLV